MQVDQLNFFAIEVLELLGNDAPNQGQIELVESLIAPVLQNKLSSDQKLTQERYAFSY